MAIDTAAKRFSMMNLAFIPGRTLPAPTGSDFNAAERAHMNGLYTGIPTAPPVTNTAHVGSRWRWGQRETWYY
jgi:hypothetical protein